MKTNLNVAAWTFGIATNEEAGKADDVIRNLGSHLANAAKMAAMAKSARHELIRHRPAYEKQIPLQETKARRAAIDKKATLGANYFGAAQAFGYYGRRVVNQLRQLDELMAHLIKGGEYTGNTDKDHERMSNAVLASNLLLTVPETIERLAGEFNMAPSEDGYNYVTGGNSELSVLAENLWHSDYAHRFGDLLKIPFIVGVGEHESVLKFEQAVADLDAVIAGVAVVVKEFSDAKARYFETALDSISSPQLADAYRVLAVDYEVASWAVENQIGEIHSRNNKILEAMQHLERGARLLPNYAVIAGNLVAVRCKYVVAEETARSIGRLIGRNVRTAELDKKTRVRNEEASTALRNAFATIPAVHRLPAMDFLTWPTRK